MIWFCQSGISERAKLESNMDYYAFSLNMLYADLFRAGIEELKLDSVIIKLKTDTSKINSVRLFPVYLAAGDVNGADSAFSVIKNISTDTTSYELTLQGINLQMLKDTLTPVEIDKYSLAAVDMFTVNNPMQSFKAKALMRSARGKKYKREPYSDGLFNNRSSEQPLESNQTTSSVNFRVFPNPTSDYVNIDISENGVYNFVLYNELGKELVSDVIDGSSHTIDVRCIPSGVYQLFIIGDSELLKVMKLVIVK